MVPVWYMLPLPSCLFAIGSLVHCVMYDLKHNVRDTDVDLSAFKHFSGLKG